MPNRNTPFAAICMYGSSLTSAQEAQEATDWQTFLTDMSRSITVTKQLVIDGNSHTIYWYSRLLCRIMKNLYGQGWIYRNFGVSGQTTTNMSSDAATQIDVLYSASYTKNILIAWEITNEISTGTSATDAYNNYVTYCQNRQAAGWTVIAMPPMARYFAGDTTKILATDTCVTNVRANWATFADAFCDHPSSNYFVPRSDYASDAAYVSAIQTLTSNATYYSDSTHLTQLGYKEWGESLTTTINSL